MDEVWFKQARAIWPEGRSKELNLTAGFRTLVNIVVPQSAILRITASSIYRLFVNGQMVGSGPARGPHGYYRVDEWDITNEMGKGMNVVAIEVAGYNVNSFYLLDQPSFVQAELRLNGEVIAFTAATEGQFQAAILEERVQRVQRYSFQRTFIEYYRLHNEFDLWKKDPDSEMVEVIKEDCGIKLLLGRHVSYPAYSVRKPAEVFGHGRFEQDKQTEHYWRDRSLTNIGTLLAGFALDELELIASDEVQELVTVHLIEDREPYEEKASWRLTQGDYQIFDFGINLTGTLGVILYCEAPAKLYMVFDEIMQDGDIDFLRLYSASLIGYELEPGYYDIESMEPYTFRYAKILVVYGAVEVSGLRLRELVNPDTNDAKLLCDQAALNEIYEAAVQTFKQNATDLYMDCPSRERAAWLCDSYFTARVEYWLTGNSRIETNFFENYLLPEHFAFLPKGMLPMCYPADHNDGVFIPNWALWFIIQLEEYSIRSGNYTMVNALKNKVDQLFEYFKPFLNEDGLLEKLEGWVFVEWSKANELIKDVNYPSNMLYAGALSAAGRMYKETSLLEQANLIREFIREQSYNGKFFSDNAVRVQGSLQSSGMSSEVCQYYAFTFDVATPDTHPDLWKMLVDEFGPNRKKSEAYPEVFPANAFIGNYLRLDLMSRYGYREQVLKQISEYFHYMAEKTGTLWEHNDESASCSHGFASHVVQWLYCDALGIRHIDHVNKLLTIQFEPAGLEWCEGSIPAGEGHIHLKWHKEKDSIHYQVDAVEGYEVQILNPQGYLLIENADTGSNKEKRRVNGRTQDNRQDCQ